MAQESPQETGARVGVVRMGLTTETLACQAFDEMMRLTAVKYNTDCLTWNSLPQETRDAWIAAIAPIVLAEREACAKIAETTQFHIGKLGEGDVWKHIEGGYTTPVIAQAIRART